MHLTFLATQPHPVTAGGDAWITVDLDGALSPLRGPLPGGLAAFLAPVLAPLPAPAGRQRVPQGAFVAIARRPAARAPNRATLRVRRERVPAGAVVPVGRAAAPPGPRPHPIRAGRALIVLTPPRRGMPRRHKLMLALAVEVLFVGAARARQQYRPPAVLIEDVVGPHRAIALNLGAR
ncbi:hypothetical protein [Methylobacterium oryzisoli]|uniref:hypothetical protein n=1 Tax=Methylobacterium oryzisoli TaxID=3385502 RepID=UPI0038919125